MISLFSILFACDEIQHQLKSPEEQLIDLRFEQKNSLDTLYAAYGGNSLIENLSQQKTQQNPEAKGFMDSLKTTLQNSDREQFEMDCKEIGQGHNVPFVTPKAKAFFDLPTTVTACKEIALRQIEIQKLVIETQSSPN